MDDNHRTMFVANLGPEVTEALLRELFLQAGPIEKVRLTVINGVPKTFAHVIYFHECSAIYASQIFQGTRLFNRELMVQQNNTGRESGQSNFNPPREERSNFNPPREERSNFAPRGSPWYRDGRNNRQINHYRNDRDERSHSHSRHRHRDDRSSHGHHQSKHTYY